jgi:hypothetical protein
VPAFSELDKTYNIELILSFYVLLVFFELCESRGEGGVILLIMGVPDVRNATG